MPLMQHKRHWDILGMHFQNRHWARWYCWLEKQIFSWRVWPSDWWCAESTSTKKHNLCLCMYFMHSYRCVRKDLSQPGTSATYTHNRLHDNGDILLTKGEGQDLLNVFSKTSALQSMTVNQLQIIFKSYL